MTKTMVETKQLVVVESLTIFIHISASVSIFISMLCSLPMVVTGCQG